EEQRKRVRIARARMDEVDRLAVDLGAEVRKLVEPRFLRPPVVLVTPVLHQLPQVVDGNPALPAAPLDLVREAGLCQPATQVLPDRVVDADLESVDGLTHRSLPGRTATQAAAICSSLIQRECHSTCSSIP